MVRKPTDLANFLFLPEKKFENLGTGLTLLLHLACGLFSLLKVVFQMHPLLDLTKDYIISMLNTWIPLLWPSENGLPSKYPSQWQQYGTLVESSVTALQALSFNFRNTQV